MVVADDVGNIVDNLLVVFGHLRKESHKWFIDGAQELLVKFFIYISKFLIELLS